ncbi:MAG: hypothetical protein M3Y65_19015 [Pseudomonadota bacterium]|nr:hypothetical protein [Pseudomonadota bacterium]
MDKPTCAAHGMIQRGAMCGMVIVGLKYCGYQGECEHKCSPAPEADQHVVKPVVAP